MLLAELEIRHSRPVVPTRRIALGELFLPTKPAPGPGGLLVAGIVGAWSMLLDDEIREDLDRLIADLGRGVRVAQPRLRHRFQIDTHGLDRSRHKLIGIGEGIGLELDGHGAPLPQILGAIYAAGMISIHARPAVFRLIRRATRWQGPLDGDTNHARLLHYLRGDEAAFRVRDEVYDEGWALMTLGFRKGSEPARSDILQQFRRLIREAHPDHGADDAGAGQRITDLAEAKRILIGA